MSTGLSYTLKQQPRGLKWFINSYYEEVLFLFFCVLLMWWNDDLYCNKVQESHLRALSIGKKTFEQTFF